MKTNMNTRALRIGVVLAVLVGFVACVAAEPTPEEIAAFAKEMRVKYRQMVSRAGEPDAVADIQTLSIPASDPERVIPARLYVPKGAKDKTALPIVVFLHGGGFVFGDLETHDVLIRGIANATQALVLSVDYRLAPEHPYPMGPDDCEAAALWIAREAKGLFGTDRMVIGGESAGAHLSVVTLLRLRDRHGIMPFRAANLHAGCYDLALSPSVRRWGAEKLVLNTRDIEMFVRHFLVRGGDVRHPDISPIHAGLAGMPPALFTVGSRDPLVDDTLLMAPRWAAAGGKAEMEVYPGGCHVFIGFPGSNSDRCLDRIGAFMAGACRD